MSSENAWPTPTLAVTACFAVLCLASTAAASPLEPALLHVDSITVSTSKTKGNKVRGVAVVVIVDELGQPVSAARVTGSFTGDLNETVTGRTTFGGRVVLATSADTRLRNGLTFCVERVTHLTLQHDATADVETCDSAETDGGGGQGRRGPAALAVASNASAAFIPLAPRYRTRAAL